MQVCAVRLRSAEHTRWICHVLQYPLRQTLFGNSEKCRDEPQWISSLLRFDDSEGTMSLSLHQTCTSLEYTPSLYPGLDIRRLGVDSVRLPQNAVVAFISLTIWCSSQSPALLCRDPSQALSERFRISQRALKKCPSNVPAK
jgi:hypothetical protein